MSPGLAWILVALAAALLAPAFTLVWLPLLLGVPHVLADLRYLVSPGAPARVRLPAASIACLAALALHRGGSLVGLPFSSPLELALGLAALATALEARGPTEPASAATRLALLIFGLALFAWPIPALAFNAHLHNFTALGIWARLGARGTRPVMLAYLAVLAALMAGAADQTLAPLLADPALHGLVAPLAPGLPPLAVGRIGLAFAFAQVFHYAVWLHLIPTLAADRRPSPGSWQDDLGTLPFLAGLVAALAVPLAGWFDPVRVRTLYLGAAGFHAWLEWAALARGLPEGAPR